MPRTSARPAATTQRRHQGRRTRSTCSRSPCTTNTRCASRSICSRPAIRSSATRCAGASPGAGTASSSSSTAAWRRRSPRSHTISPAMRPAGGQPDGPWCTLSRLPPRESLHRGDHRLRLVAMRRVVVVLHLAFAQVVLYVGGACLGDSGGRQVLDHDERRQRQQPGDPARRRAWSAAGRAGCPARRQHRADRRPLHLRRHRRRRARGEDRAPVSAVPLPTKD